MMKKTQFVPVRSADDFIFHCSETPTVEKADVVSAVRRRRAVATSPAPPTPTDAGPQTNDRSDMINDLPDDQPPADDLDSPTEATVDSDVVDTKICVPDITADDYANDTEFAGVWTYLQTGNLSGDDTTDKKTLLMAEFYFTDNGLLYRIDLPRNKRVQRVQPVNNRLCIPEKYRDTLLCLTHDNLGHAATKRTYLSMAQKYFWQSMYPDIQRYTETCVVCQRSKISSRKSTLPLNPLPVATKPFQIINIYHKSLPRKTSQGHCALLCCIDAFSKFPIVSPVPDYSAETTAKVLMRDVISIFGCLLYTSPSPRDS